MLNQHKLRALFATVTMAAALASPASHAATGDVAIDITFPPLTILYYYTSISITVDADAFEGALIASNAPDLDACTSSGAGDLECAEPALTFAAADGSTVAGTITYDADIITAVGAALTASTIDFEIENAWAVRALGAGTLSASATAAGDFGSVSVDPAAPTTSLTLTDGDNVGDLLFTVDLETLAGLTISDTVTITVTNP